MYEFRIGDEVFHARVADGTLEALHGPAQHPDATVTIGEAAFLRVTALGRTFADAIESGDAEATGDRAALRRLKGLFRLPPSGRRQ